MLTPQMLLIAAALFVAVFGAREATHGVKAAVHHMRHHHHAAKKKPVKKPAAKS